MTMTRLAAAVCCAVLAFPLFARNTPDVQRLEADPQRLPRLIKQIKAAKAAARECRGTQAITDNRTARTIVFPAAGSVRGAGGEFFRSEVSLDGYPDSVIVVWLGRGATGEPPTFKVNIHDQYGYPKTYSDFVGETLGLESALGALWFVPVDDEGNFDPTAVLDGFSRIWTNQPGGTGTVSQQFQAVDPFSFDFYTDTLAYGLQHNSQYRTSWGIVNLDTEPHRFSVFATSLLNNGQDDLDVTIPAMSMQQQGLPREVDFGPNGMFVVIRLLDDWPEGEDPPTFVAYGSSTDNRTGDGWVVLSSADWEDEDFSLSARKRGPRP
jgi:hypothetical protein